ncbi:MAG: hypothetical protein ABFD97_01550 [Syntrophobacter sp.]
MPFSAALLSMKPLYALLIIMAAFMLPTMAGFLVTRKFMPAGFEPSHNNIVGYIFGTLGVVYAVVLGFAIFLVWQEYEDSEHSVALEAGEALAVYHDLSLYPDPAIAKPLKESLASYLKSIISEEYPAMARMERSKATDGAFLDLWIRFKTLAPGNLQEQTVYSRTLTDMHSLAKSRTDRLQASYDELPEMIWLVLMVGAIATLGCTLFFSADHVKSHLALTCLLAAVIATVWFVIMGLDHPFLGWACIKATHCEKALEVMLQGL